MLGIENGMVVGAQEAWDAAWGGYEPSWHVCRECQEPVPYGEDYYETDNGEDICEECMRKRRRTA